MFWLNKIGGTASGVASPKILRGMFDFRRITLFCLEKRLSKHKMTRFSKNLGDPWPLWPSRSYAYGHCSWMPPVATALPVTNWTTKAFASEKNIQQT